MRPMTEARVGLLPWLMEVLLGLLLLCLSALPVVKVSSWIWMEKGAMIVVLCCVVSVGF